MKEPAASKQFFLTVVVTVLVCSVTGSGLLFAGKQKPGEYQVKLQKGHYLKLNNRVDGQAADETKEALRTGGDIVFVHTEILRPPDGWLFAKFTGSTTHVDIEPRVLGLASMRWTDKDNAIEVHATYPAQQAGTYPLKLEGNLKRKTQGKNPGHGRRETQAFWRVKVKDQQKQQKPRLRLTADLKYIMRSSSSSSRISKNLNLTVEALNKKSEPQDGVPITLTIKVDHGTVLFGDPFAQGKTQVDPYSAVPMYNPPFGRPLPKPPAQATKYIITATSTAKYRQDQITLPIVDARWVAREVARKDDRSGFDGTLHGFDDSESTPWLVVGIGADNKSTASKLQLDTGVHGAVNISVDHAAQATITPSTTGQATTPTDVTGKQKSSVAHALAMQGDAELARMNLDIKNTKTFNVRFIFVKDSEGHDGTIGNAGVIFNTVQGIWMDQAVVNLVKLKKQLTETWTIPDKIGAAPTSNTIGHEIAAHRPEPKSNQIFIYIVQGLVLPYNAIGVTFTPGRIILVNSKSKALTYAHEIGHALGLGHSESGSDIMYPYADGGQHISRREADVANP